MYKTAKTGDLASKVLEVKKFIEELQRNLRTGDALPVSLRESPIMFSQVELGSLLLEPEEAREYRKVLIELCGATSKNGVVYFSDRHVEDVFQTTLLLALSNHQDKRDFAAKLKDSLQFLTTELKIKPTPCEVILQVNGISLKGLPYSAGKVTFCACDLDFIANLQTKVQEAQSDPSMPDLSCHFLEQIREHYAGNVVAVVKVDAVDNTAARLLALEELRNTIDVLHHYVDILFGAGTLIYLPGEADSSGHFSLVFREDGSLQVSNSLSGPSSAFSFEDQHILRGEKNGLLEALQILSKNECTPLEKRILNAIRWSGRATIEQQMARSFLFYAIALETLLLPENNVGELTYRLGVNCANLLASDKHNVVSTVRNLYKLRSNIVHSGGTHVPANSYADMWGITKSCITRLLKDEKFKVMRLSNKSTLLDEWFENEALVGSSNYSKEVE